jgi:hypothetical protein
MSTWWRSRRGPFVADEVISLAAKDWAADARITAAWLEGSRSLGGDDGQGDYDFHIAVRVQDWDDVCDERLELLSSVGNRLAFAEASGEAVWLVSAVFADDVWVDLNLERDDAIGERRRLDEPIMLFDRHRVEESLEPASSSELAELFRAHLTPLLESFSWYSVSGSKLARRGDLLSLVHGAHRLLFDFVVPGLLIAAGEQLPRPHGFNERYLRPEARLEVINAVRRLPAATSDVTALAAGWTEASEIASAALRRASDRWI